MMKGITLATMTAIGVAAGAAAQQSSQERPRGGDRTAQVSFEAADRNSDGRINREEGNRIDGFDFSRADTDGDRELTRQEFDAAMASSTPRGDRNPLDRDRSEQVAFEDADKNSDGTVDRDEAEDIDGFDFSEADVDDDRSLSRQEYQAAMRTSRPRG